MTKLSGNGIIINSYLIQAGLDHNNITLESDLYYDMQWDDLDFTDFAQYLGEVLDMDIGMLEIRDCETVSDLAFLIEIYKKVDL